MSDIVDRANDEAQYWVEVQINAMHHEATTDTNCVECGEPIGVNRKSAIPWTIRCFQCQSDYEGDVR